MGKDDDAVIIGLGLLGLAFLVSLLSKKRCNYCGNDNPPLNTHCNFCGRRLQ